MADIERFNEAFNYLKDKPALDVAEAMGFNPNTHIFRLATAEDAVTTIRGKRETARVIGLLVYNAIDSTESTYQDYMQIELQATEDNEVTTVYKHREEGLFGRGLEPIPIPETSLDIAHESAFVAVEQAIEASVAKEDRTVGEYLKVFSPIKGKNRQKIVENIEKPDLHGISEPNGFGDAIEVQAVDSKRDLSGGTYLKNFSKANNSHRSVPAPKKRSSSQRTTAENELFSAVNRARDARLAFEAREKLKNQQELEAQQSIDRKKSANQLQSDERARAFVDIMHANNVKKIPIYEQTFVIEEGYVERYVPVAHVSYLTGHVESSTVRRLYPKKVYAPNPDFLLGEGWIISNYNPISSKGGGDLDGVMLLDDAQTFYFHRVYDTSINAEREERSGEVIYIKSVSTRDEGPIEELYAGDRGLKLLGDAIVRYGISA